ncbi:MAG: BsuPI-related putative proteinase inhibitor [Gemmatimonadales bacterium]
MTIGGALFLATCGTGAPDRQRVTDTVTTTPPSLRFELLAPADAATGDPVAITLRLTNTSERPVELHLVGRTIAFDIVIACEGGAVVWGRLAGATVQGILQIRMLAPGETLELKDVWRQQDGSGKRVPAGTYILHGVLPTDEPQPLRTPPVELRITPS